MRIDPLQQYAKLRRQLIEERSQIEARLNEINQVLGSEVAATAAPPGASAPAAPVQPVARRGGGPRGGNTMSLREAIIKVLARGPLSRKEVVAAVQDVGYAFTTKNPLNSVGSVLYAKDGPIRNKDGKFYLRGNAQPETRENGQAEAPVRRRRMSEEARARIAAAQRARRARERGEM
jgi:hypothetical protein